MKSYRKLASTLVEQRTIPKDSMLVGEYPFDEKAVRKFVYQFADKHYKNNGMTGTQALDMLNEGRVVYVANNRDVEVSLMRCINTPDKIKIYFESHDGMSGNKIKIVEQKAEAAFGSKIR